MIRSPIRSPIGAALRSPFMAGLRASTEAIAIARARSMDAMWLYPASALANVYQDSAGTTGGALAAPIGLLLDRQYGGALGAELITNGGFSSDLAGWSTGSDAANVVATYDAGAGGRAKLTRGSGGNGGGLQQTITTISGRVYRIEVTAVPGAAGVAMRVDTGVLGNQLFSGNLSVLFVANGATASLYFWPINNNDTVYVDNVTVKEVPGSHASQATAADKPVASSFVNSKPGFTFDGTSDYLLTTRSPGSSGTLIWAGTLPGTAAGARVLIGAGGNSSGNTGACLRISNNKLALAISNGTTSSSLVAVDDTINQQAVVMARWRANEQEVWVNGVLVASAALAIDPTTSARTFTLHRQSSDIANNWCGGVAGVVGIAGSWASNAAANDLCAHAASHVGGTWSSLP